MARSVPRAVRGAGVLVAGEGVVGVGYVGALAGYALAGAPQPAAVVAQAGFFLIMGAAVVGVGVGLVVGRRWARTPAIVVQLLLLPIVYTLLGPNQQLVYGALAGALVITTFLLLISEPARRWSMGPSSSQDSDRRSG